MQPFAAPEEDLRLREACHLESAGHPVEFSPETLAELEKIFSRYPQRPAAIIPALWLAQRDFGWISAEAIEMIARLCEVAPAHVYGVVSFYTMFNRTPVGKYHLQLCTNLSCQLRGAEHMLECLREELGIDLGETTADRLVTLSEVECLAACEMAPVLQVNEDFLGPMTRESIRELLARLRAEGGRTGAAPEARP
jgi:NADH-quinone oxidoreductase E subunit